MHGRQHFDTRRSRFCGGRRAVVQRSSSALIRTRAGGRSRRLVPAITWSSADQNEVKKRANTLRTVQPTPRQVHHDEPRWSVVRRSWFGDLMPKTTSSWCHVTEMGTHAPMLARTRATGVLTRRVAKHPSHRTANDGTRLQIVEPRINHKQRKRHNLL
jgi:hypothetical protein